MSDSTRPASVPELIDAFGGNTAFAKVIGKAPSTAGEQKRNGSIPVEYWPAILEAAPNAGIEVSYDSLVDMHVARRAAAEARA